MPNNTMNIVKAALLVAKDQLQSYDWTDLGDALEYAYNSVNPDSLTEDDELAEAYRVFINWRSDNGPIGKLPKL